MCEFASSYSIVARDLHACSTTASLEIRPVPIDEKRGLGVVVSPPHPYPEFTAPEEHLLSMQSLEARFLTFAPGISHLCDRPSGYLALELGAPGSL